MKSAFSLAAAAFLALSASAAFAQGAGAPPAAPPAGPSNEGSLNPYGGPREGDPGDSMTYLNNEREAAKAVRDADARRGGGGVKGTAADPNEIAAGNEVRDRKGAVVGKVEAVELDGAVVAAAAGRVKVPLEAFGKNRRGLVIGITKAEFDALVASATAQPAG